MAAGLAALLLAGCAGGQAASVAEADVVARRVGPGFTSHRIDLADGSLHYVRGGAGPAVVLLHGYPQDWSEWRHVMPRLAGDFTVISVDLRGIGGSRSARAGHDAATLAGDVHELARRLDLGPIYVAGHDIGGMVAYAYARRFPGQTRGVMVLDVPLPGIEPWSQIERDPIVWHFHFHRTVELPEALIRGRERLYFRDFMNRFALHDDRITDADVAHFAQAYASAEALRAGFELYRAFPATATFNAARREKLDVPIVLAGGDHAVGPLNGAIAETLRAHGCTSVSVEMIADSGHYVAEEQPAAVASLIRRHAARPAP